MDHYDNRDVVFFTLSKPNKLVVEFGDGKNAVLELKDSEETELVETLLEDPNLWASFLGSLSAAIGKHK